MMAFERALLSSRLLLICLSLIAELRQEVSILPEVYSHFSASLFRPQMARRVFGWMEACGLAWKRLKGALVSDAILVQTEYTGDFLLDWDGPGGRGGG